MGRLGGAARELILARDDMELVECFTRANADTLIEFKDKIDVLLVCVGSSHDAPIITPEIAKNFSTVDSFDTHAELGTYMENIKANQGEGLVSVVGTGWDPGMLSLQRLLLLPIMGNVETFWGPGVSLGHSNAVRAIKGVQSAIQFTIPRRSAIRNVRRGKTVNSQDKHRRLCYVVAPIDEYRRIAQEIKGMPHYFAPYKTTVKFISQAKFDAKFQGRQEHTGRVIARDDKSLAEFSLKIGSNPHWTAGAMLGYTVAAWNLKREGQSGVFTVADIAPRLLHKKCVLEVI